MNISIHAQQRMASRAISKELIKLVMQYGKVEFNRGCEIYKLTKKAINDLPFDRRKNHQIMCKANRIYVVAKETLIITAGYKTKRFKVDRN